MNKIVLILITSILVIPNVLFAGTISWAESNEANYTVTTNKDAYAPGENIYFSTSMTATYLSFVYDWPSINAIVDGRTYNLIWSGLWGGQTATTAYDTKVWDYATCICQTYVTAPTAPGSYNITLKGIVASITNGPGVTIPITVGSPLGTITTTSTPPGATWTISNGPAGFTIPTNGTAGDTLTGKPTGMYTLNWNSVVGYTTPPSQTLNLPAGGTVPFSGTYTLNSYTVSASAGANGSISPSSRTVSHGSNTTFTVTPSAGYTASASGCGGSLSGSTYTTGAITSTCIVSATFAAAPVCANGATNYPACSQCSSGQAYNTISSQCVVCTGGCSGAGNTSGTGATCLNGASNPPFCILASCTLPWGASLSSGSTAPAYSVPSVISHATCPAPQTYTCTNGVLSGSTYTNQNCTASAIKLKYQQF